MRNGFIASAIVAAIVAAPASAKGELTANEKVVAAFLDEMDRMTANRAVDDVPRIVRTYWTVDCIQHRKGVAPGQAGLIASLKNLSPAPSPEEAARRKAGPVMETVSITSGKDRVIAVRRRVTPDPANSGKVVERYVFNVYRLENGKIAENWWSLSS